MKKLTVSGKTIEDAVKAGLSEWNVPESRVKIHVLEQPSKGLFGFIGSKDAKVQLELLPDPIEEAFQFVKDVIRSIPLNVEASLVEQGGQVVVQLSGPELGILIGRRGHTLDSLQYLVNIVANRYSDKHLRIVVDAEHFRERRTQTLMQLSDRLADKVVRTGRDVVLEPMSPPERRIIHANLQNHPRVRTFSKGEEPNRRIVITLK